ncbi:EpsI family protein [Pseudodesulfovibrio thermohalotolerans]|uniref:exosortase C-terminal domain/associated protein EpsI n=1 Tax=Pseudodesulfovibrio thermohalotolerans TaxID=2880651 RepID=UPI0024420E97|nr:exosortase C-terminal domain/associated protein EpsI [Pseudodesulfovibrio thermohalotolerans]WFS61602.1 EpsI family protein [Pseudodesulfovibrio thermohalotolerans]
MKRRIFIICLLVLCAGAFVNLHSDVAVPLSRPLGEFPVKVGQWRMVHEWRYAQGILEVLQATGYVSRQYRDEQGRVVELYLGYHDGGPDAGPIHSPRNCLPGGGWLQRFEKIVGIDLGGRSMKAVQAAYDKSESTVTMLYWFQVCGKIVTNEYALKIEEIIGSITSRRRDSAFIRLSTEIPDENGGAERTLQRFAEDFYPVIEAFLPAPTGGR